MKAGMIKTVSLATCICLFVSALCSCSLFSGDNSTPQSTSVMTEPSTSAIIEPQATFAADNPTETTAQATGISVITSSYTLTLPSAWENAYATKYKMRANGMVTISFYQTASHDYGYGDGILFGIAFYSIDEDYTDVPNYDLIGTYTFNDGSSYNVLVIYPSEVQYSQETQADYETMAQFIPSIVSTFTAIGSVGVFTPVV